MGEPGHCGICLLGTCPLGDLSVGCLSIEGSVHWGTSLLGDQAIESVHLVPVHWGTWSLMASFRSPSFLITPQSGFISLDYLSSKQVEWGVDGWADALNWGEPNAGRWSHFHQHFLVHCWSVPGSFSSSCSEHFGGTERGIHGTELYLLPLEIKLDWWEERLAIVLYTGHPLSLYTARLWFSVVNVECVLFLFFSIVLMDCFMYLAKPHLPGDDSSCNLNHMEHSEEPKRKQNGWLWEFEIPGVCVFVGVLLPLVWVLR